MAVADLNALVQDIKARGQALVATAQIKDLVYLAKAVEAVTGQVTVARVVEQGDTEVARVNTTGTTAVADVNNAKTSSLTAIANAGAAQLASLATNAALYIQATTPEYMRAVRARRAFNAAFFV